MSIGWESRREAAGAAGAQHVGGRGRARAHGVGGSRLWRQYDADRTLARAILTAMSAEGRSRCEAQPETFGGGTLDLLPPLAIFRTSLESQPQLFAYDSAFRPANPSAPPFPDDLRAALLAGEPRAAGAFRVPSAEGRHLALRMPWTDGPCAILLSRFGAFALPFSTEMLRLGVLTVAFIGSAFLAAVPIIARLRRLTAAVRASADSMYATHVPETLPDEIGDLERAFNRAGDQVKAQVATIEDREVALRSVVSNTTHDVAVPLTVVQGHLSAALSLLPPASPALEKLREAVRETHYLGALLHNLGAAARLDRSTSALDGRSLDLIAVVERVVARHQPIAGALDVDLVAAVPEHPVPITADVTLLEQAASNLVHNALHYNKPGGHVAVILEAVDGGRRFSIRVIDDGPGIPAAERAHLTERTFRGAAGRARRPEGQGLGLHIVREVVDRHGFDLHIGESEYGGAEIEIEGALAPRTPPTDVENV